MLKLVARVIASIKRRVHHIIILSQARKNSITAIKEREGNKILVICYGNIYRSPLAEYILKRVCSSDKYKIKSAGFHNKLNRKCEPEYLKILEKFEYDLSDHRSKIIQNSDTSWADLIIIMDRYNWDMLKQLDAGCVNKIIWIGAFSKNKNVEVKDPYGKGVEFTKKVVSDLEVCINDLCQEINDNM
jgi:protein-tyrosine phosphatase